MSCIVGELLLIAATLSKDATMPIKNLEVRETKDRWLRGRISLGKRYMEIQDGTYCEMNCEVNYGVHYGYKY